MDQTFGNAACRSDRGLAGRRGEKREPGDRRGLRAQDARAERDGANKGAAREEVKLPVREAAFGADQQAGLPAGWAQRRCRPPFDRREERAVGRPGSEQIGKRPGRSDLGAGHPFGLLRRLGRDGDKPRRAGQHRHRTVGAEGQQPLGAELGGLLNQEFNGRALDERERKPGARLGTLGAKPAFDDELATPGGKRIDPRQKLAVASVEQHHLVPRAPAHHHPQIVRLGRIEQGGLAGREGNTDEKPD